MSKFIVYGLYIATVILYVVYVIFQDATSPLGEELYSIQKQVKDLHAENTDLQAKIAQARALTTIAEEAKEQGFTDKVTYYYLK